MNRKSVVRLLKAKKKITHTFFEPHEFIKLKGDRRVDENGVNIGSIESFVEGSDMAFPNDWKVYKL